MPCPLGIVGLGGNQRETIWFIFFPLFCEAPLVLEPVSNALITPVINNNLVLVFDTSKKKKNKK
jgi:hypothetical protein